MTAEFSISPGSNLTEQDKTAIIAAIEYLLREGKGVDISVEPQSKTRTLTQSKSLHLWCTQLAEVLNSAGLDMRYVIREDVDIPWSGATVKEHIWRTVQKALTNKQSTTEIGRAHV